MLFEVFFLFFYSGSHFVQRSKTNWAILVEDLPRNNQINFGWNPPSGYRDVICLFYFWLWWRTSKGTILSTLVEIHQVVTEEMSFEANCGQRTTDARHRAITIAQPEHVVLRWAENKGRLIFHPYMTHIQEGHDGPYTRWPWWPYIAHLNYVLDTSKSFEALKIFNEGKPCKSLF